MSYQRYGRPRSEIESEITARYQKESSTFAPPLPR
jgi:hypothetical protein